MIFLAYESSEWMNEYEWKLRAENSDALYRLKIYVFRQMRICKDNKL